MSPLACVLLFFSVTACLATTRIMGGRPTTIQKYPSMVQVQAQVTLWNQVCAGSIITTRHIISAAHCFSGPTYAPRFRRIIAGSTYRNVPGVRRNVLYAINHPSYNHDDHDGDISVVVLDAPLIFSDAIQRVTILGQGAPFPYDVPVIQAGWGISNLELPDIHLAELQEITVFTMNHDECVKRFANDVYPRTVTSNMICAGSLFGGGPGACVGDNGGPLYFNNVLIGVISWGLECANTTLPRVHTAISSYSNWIILTVS